MSNIAINNPIQPAIHHQHKNKCIDLPMKSFVTTKSSREDSGQTEDVFSPDKASAILIDLRIFAKSNELKITNCIFRRDQVEICYFLNDSSCAVQNRDELKQQLVEHLNIDSKLIKMTKLRARPICKETTLRPGETAAIQSKGDCKIGAFVEVEGKGNHALVSGHGKGQGDLLLYPNGDQLGVVSVSLHPPLQPSANETWCCYYSDVALVRLDVQHRYIAQVLDDIRGPLGLTEQPINAANNMVVRRYTEDGRRGKVDSKDYISLDDTHNIKFRLISVVSEEGGPIHVKGESGILIVTDTPVNGKVSAVGILVRLERMEEENEDQTVRVREMSLAVPIQANFEALGKDSYCNGATIKFLY